jgi:hypothetical protein
MDQHHFGNLYPHQMKITSGSASNKNQDPDPHQFADDKPKRMEYKLILS